MELEVCLLCERSNMIPLFSESRAHRVYTSYYCKKCDLHQTLGDIDAVSPDYVGLGIENIDAAHRFLQQEHKLLAFKQWENLFRRQTGALSSSSLLDIGCGVGGFLDFAKSCGVKTFGFDASEAHVKDALSRHPNVRQAVTVRDYFDRLGRTVPINLVTLWDVLEHVRTPVLLLAEVRTLISREDGLVFVSVPNGAMNPMKVCIAKAFGRPIGLIPWEHVFYYTTNSLRAVLNRAGLDVVEIGGLKPYLRKPLSPQELFRRMLHYLLSPTPYAFQIYAIARPAK